MSTFTLTLSESPTLPAESLRQFVTQAGRLGKTARQHLADVIGEALKAEAGAEDRRKETGARRPEPPPPVPPTKNPSPLTPPPP